MKKSLRELCSVCGKTEENNIPLGPPKASAAALLLMPRCTWVSVLISQSLHSLCKFYFSICYWITLTGLSHLFVLALGHNSIQKCVCQKWGKRHQAGRSITPLSLEGPSGHILRKLGGEYSCIYSVCIYYVFSWLEMAYSMLISLLCHA